jgi:hypothetical protein
MVIVFEYERPAAWQNMEEDIDEAFTDITFIALG